MTVTGFFFQLNIRSSKHGLKCILKISRVIVHRRTQNKYFRSTAVACHNTRPPASSKGGREQSVYSQYDVKEVIVKVTVKVIIVKVTVKVLIKPGQMRSVKVVRGQGRWRSQ